MGCLSHRVVVGFLLEIKGGRMSKIVLTRGLPASGKSTWAKKFVKLYPNTVRVNRDDIRAQMYPISDYRDIDEDLITEVETAMVRAALRQDKQVVVDAMHLQQRYINRWQRLGYPIEIREFRTPLEVLLRRNDEREVKVPTSVIIDNYKKYTNKDGSLRKVSLKPEEYVIDYKYVPDSTKPTAVIVDIDGTLAHNDGHRSFYDYSKVLDDNPVWPVIDAANGLNTIHHTVVVSGRKAECREDTEAWLNMHGVQYDEIYMRADEDDRADTIVKMEILRDKIAPEFEVIAAIDDRPSVCEMWRKVGIPTFQVGDPENRF